MPAQLTESVLSRCVFLQHDLYNPTKCSNRQVLTAVLPRIQVYQVVMLQDDETTTRRNVEKPFTPRTPCPLLD